MKTLFNTTNKKLITIISLLFIITLLSECKKDPGYAPENAALNRDASTTGSETVNCASACEKTVDLMAGQHIKVGTVHYKNNSNGTIDVTYTVNAPWKISFVALYMGNCSQIPKNSTGNPIPGQFLYKQTFETGQTSVTLSVPRSAVPTCGCMAAHASVYNTQTGATETAWGEGTRFTYTNWAMYYQYCLTECQENCGYPSWYWFVDFTTPWPKNSLTIGGQTYTKQECYDITHAPTDYNNTPDAKKCFIQVCSAKLSAGHVSPNAPIWADVQICENYLSSLGEKLSPDFLPTGDENAFAAADRIELWIKANPCIGK